jgi:hypothetical protein
MKTIALQNKDESSIRFFNESALKNEHFINKVLAQHSRCRSKRGEGAWTGATITLKKPD